MSFCSLSTRKRVVIHSIVQQCQCWLNTNGVTPLLDLVSMAILHSDLNVWTIVAAVLFIAGSIRNFGVLEWSSPNFSLFHKLNTVSSILAESRVVEAELNSKCYQITECPLPNERQPTRIWFTNLFEDQRYLWAAKLYSINGLLKMREWSNASINRR